jgi:hypothetical protein
LSGFPKIFNSQSALPTSTLQLLSTNLDHAVASGI